MDNLPARDTSGPYGCPERLPHKSWPLPLRPCRTRGTRWSLRASWAFLRSLSGTLLPLSPDRCATCPHRPHPLWLTPKWSDHEAENLREHRLRKPVDNKADTFVVRSYRSKCPPY